MTKVRREPAAPGPRGRRTAPDPPPPGPVPPGWGVRAVRPRALCPFALPIKHRCHQRHTHRRGKVRSIPLPPSGKAPLRSLAPPLPTKPKSGFAGAPCQHELRSFASACGESSSAPLCLLSPQKQMRGPYWPERNRFRQYTTSWGKSTAFFVEGAIPWSISQKVRPKPGENPAKGTAPPADPPAGRKTAPGKRPGPGCHPFRLASSASMARNTGIMPILSGVWAGIW